MCMLKFARKFCTTRSYSDELIHCLETTVKTFEMDSKEVSSEEAYSDIKQDIPEEIIISEIEYIYFLSQRVVLQNQ